MSLEVIGRPGVWYVTVEGYGRVACYHEHLRNGDHHYRQDSSAGDFSNREAKRRQAEWAAKTGLAVKTIDNINRRPWKRQAYTGIYRIYSVRFEGYVTTFRIGERIDSLHRPSEAR